MFCMLDKATKHLQSYGLSYCLGLSRGLGGTPALIGAINAVLGVIGALLAEVLGAQGQRGRRADCRSVRPSGMMRWCSAS